MEDNKSKSVLTATVTNAPQKSQADKDYEAMQAEMTAELNAKGTKLMIDQALKTPVVASIIDQAMNFLPMAVKFGEDYLEKGKVTILIYIDEETGAFVLEKAHNDKIDLTRKEKPNPKDFFFIEKKDLDNPKEFVEKMKDKFNINLF